MRVPSPLPPLLDALLSPHTHIYSLAAVAPTDGDNIAKHDVTKSNFVPRDPRQRPAPLIVEDDVEEGEEGEEEGEVAQTTSVQKPKRQGGRVPCKYWMEGKCSKGDQCTFNHQLTPNRTVDQVRLEHRRLLELPAHQLLAMCDATPGTTLWDILTQGVCRFRMGRSGSCTKGDHCLYSHDLHLLPCRFWHAWGRCAQGKECRFSHGEIEAVLRDRIRAEAVEAVQRERALGKRKADGDYVGGIGGAGENAGENDDNVDSNQHHQHQDDAFSEELARQINPFA